MAYTQQRPVQQPRPLPQSQLGGYTSLSGGVVSGEQYRYALINFRIAHERVESQRRQLEAQERQVAQLKQRISLLEGSNDQWPGGSSIDEVSIKNAASQLEALINRWAADTVRSPPVPLEKIRDAAFIDILGSVPHDSITASSMVVQYMLRHILSETISEGVVNCLIVTSSHETNMHLTWIHEHIFDRDPTVACVWRRQTFSAAIDSCPPEMSKLIVTEHMPSLASLLANSKSATAITSILDSAYAFSRMLHGTSGGTIDGFYRAFVPELAAELYPRQIELVKRCLRSERGESCRVGASVFPGLVKVTRGGEEGQQIVLRRAQAICECALGLGSAKQ